MDEFLHCNNENTFRGDSFRSYIVSDEIEVARSGTITRCNQTIDLLFVFRGVDSGTSV